MRIVSIALLVILVGVVLTFKVQNLEAVTVSFLSASLTMPLSILLAGVYALGMATGGLALSLVRGWIRRAAPPRDKPTP